jgi:hypothetical protein
MRGLGAEAEAEAGGGRERGRQSSTPRRAAGDMGWGGTELCLSEDGRRGDEGGRSEPASGGRRPLSTPSSKGKTECIDHVCAGIKLHTRNDIVNTKISATQIKSYYNTIVLNET